MIILNVLRLNEWSIKKFSLTILFITILYCISLFIEVPFYSIKLLHQFLGFIILTFLPGILILRVLRITNIDNVLNILFIIGLSLAFNTLSIFLLNIVFITINLGYNLINSFIYIYLFEIWILLLICYLNSHEIKENVYINLNIKQIALLIILPSISIFGAFVINSYNINHINIIFMMLISIIPFFYKYKNYLSLLIWIPSLSILLNNHLTSEYLWGWDVHFQYYIANSILNTGCWNPDYYVGVNSVLTTTLLASAYSIFLDLNLISIYKIIYPFFFSFVPLGIYYLIDNQFINKNLAFFSSFVFIFYYGYFKSMIDKEFVAELFFILVLIVLFCKLDDIKPLQVIFLIMLPITHYGLSYIFLLLLISAKIIGLIFKIKNNLRINFILYLAIILISWNIFVSNGIIFSHVVEIGNHLLVTISDIFLSNDRTGIYYLSLSKPGVFWPVYKALNASIIGFISVGILMLIYTYKNKNSIISENSLMLLMISFYMFLLVQIVENLGLGIDRSLQMSLTILSPLTIIGLNQMIEIVKYKILRNKLNINIWRTILPIYLCILFLFNSGVIIELSNSDLIYAIPLNKNPQWNVYSTDEVIGVKWLKIYGGEYNISVINPWSGIKSRDAMLASEFFPQDKLKKISFNTSRLTKSYIFIGKLNDNLNSAPLYIKILNKSDKLLNNGGSSIYIN